MKLAAGTVSGWILWCTLSSQVSYEDVDQLKAFGELENVRIPHFMQDLDRYMQQLDHIVATNCLSDQELESLLPA